VTPIRPSAYPVQPAANPAVDAARQAAQKAFFAAAMGKAAAPTATQAPSLSPAPARVQRAELRPDPTAEAPTKVLRPGSLLDIRV
jgi:hypothetical protein